MTDCVLIPSYIEGALDCFILVLFGLLVARWGLIKDDNTGFWSSLLGVTFILGILFVILGLYPYIPCFRVIP